MYKSYQLTSHFTYCENKEEVTQWVKVNLEEHKTNVEGLKKRINCIDNQEEVFAFEGNRKLVYATEALTPKPEAIKGGINLLLLLGNPAIHSVIDGMFFSYEGIKNREHRFWDGLRSCCLYTGAKPTSKKDIAPGKALADINEARRQELLKVTYAGEPNFNPAFNIFLMTYFSFPTPASKDYNGVAGIKKIFCDRDKDMRDIFFKEMLDFEFCRFKHVVSTNKITNVICFQKDAWNEIIGKSQNANLISNQRYVSNDLQSQVRQIGFGDNSLNLTLYRAKSTRLIRSRESKQLLKDIICAIKANVNSENPS